MAQPNRFSPGAGQGMRGTFGSPPPQTVNTPRPSGLPAPPTGGPTTYNPDLSQTSGPLPYQTQSYIKAEEEMENTNKLDPIVDEDGGMNWAAMLLGGAAAGMAAFGGGNLRAIGQLAGAGIAGGVSGVAASAAINLEREEKEEIRREKEGARLFNKMAEAYRNDQNAIGDRLASEGIKEGYWDKNTADVYMEEGTKNIGEKANEDAKAEAEESIRAATLNGDFERVRTKINKDTRLTEGEKEHYLLLVDSTAEAYGTSEYRTLVGNLRTSNDPSDLKAFLNSKQILSGRHPVLKQLAEEKLERIVGDREHVLNMRKREELDHRFNTAKEQVKTELQLWNQGAHEASVEVRLARLYPEDVDAILAAHESGEDDPRYTETFEHLLGIERRHKVGEAIESLIKGLRAEGGYSSSVILSRASALGSELDEIITDTAKPKTQEQKVDDYVNRFKDEFITDSVLGSEGAPSSSERANEEKEIRTKIEANKTIPDNLKSAIIDKLIKALRDSYKIRHVLTLEEQTRHDSLFTKLMGVVRAPDTLSAAPDTLSAAPDTLGRK